MYIRKSKAKDKFSPIIHAARVALKTIPSEAVGTSQVIVAVHGKERLAGFAYATLSNNVLKLNTVFNLPGHEDIGMAMATELVASNGHRMIEATEEIYRTCGKDLGFYFDVITGTYKRDADVADQMLAQSSYHLRPFEVKADSKFDYAITNTSGKYYVYQGSAGNQWTSYPALADAFASKGDADSELKKLIGKGFTTAKDAKVTKLAIATDETKVLKTDWMSSPESIAKSLETAEADTNKHRALRGKILDSQPDGTVLNVHRRDYTKQTLGNDVFWVSSKGGLTSSQLAIELGTKLDRLLEQGVITDSKTAATLASSVANLKQGKVGAKFDPSEFKDVLDPDTKVNQSRSITESELRKLGEEVMAKELAIGTEIEAEHKDTYDFVATTLADTGKMPGAEEFFKLIRDAHIKEFPTYYVSLKYMMEVLESMHRELPYTGPKVDYDDWGLYIEKEHQPTYDFIKDTFEKTGKAPTADEVFAHIAQDHIDKYAPHNYYEALVKMESELKKTEKQNKESSMRKAFATDDDRLKAKTLDMSKIPLRGKQLPSDQERLSAKALAIAAAPKTGLGPYISLRDPDTKGASMRTLLNKTAASSEDVRDLLSIPSGGKKAYKIKNLYFTVYFDSETAQGDLGEKVPGMISGDYEVTVSKDGSVDPVNAETILRQHVSPGKPGELQQYYAAGQCVDAMLKWVNSHGKDASMRTAFTTDKDRLAAKIQSSIQAWDKEMDAYGFGPDPLGGWSRVLPENLKLIISERDFISPNDTLYWLYKDTDADELIGSGTVPNMQTLISKFKLGTQAAKTPGMGTPYVSLRDPDTKEEIWTGSLFEFFTYNRDMDEAEQTRIHQELESKGEVATGGGAAPEFLIKKISSKEVEALAVLLDEAWVIKKNDGTERYLAMTLNGHNDTDFVRDPGGLVVPYYDKESAEKAAKKMDAVLVPYSELRKTWNPSDARAVATTNHIGESDTGEMESHINDLTRPLTKEKANKLMTFLKGHGIMTRRGKSDYRGGYGWTEPRYNVYWKYDGAQYDKVQNLYSDWERGWSTAGKSEPMSIEDEAIQLMYLNKTAEEIADVLCEDFGITHDEAYKIADSTMTKHVSEYRKSMEKSDQERLSAKIKAVATDTTGVPRIRIAYETITEESAEEGDAADRGWIDEEGVEMDIDDVVGSAIKFLNKNGATEPYSSSFESRVWYTSIGEMDMHSGEYENRSYHLVDFTEDQKRQIYEGVTGHKSASIKSVADHTQILKEGDKVISLKDIPASGIKEGETGVVCVPDDGLGCSVLFNSTVVNWVDPSDLEKVSVKRKSVADTESRNTGILPPAQVNEGQTIPANVHDLQCMQDMVTDFDTFTKKNPQSAPAVQEPEAIPAMNQPVPKNLSERENEEGEDRVQTQFEESKAPTDIEAKEKDEPKAGQRPMHDSSEDYNDSMTHHGSKTVLSAKEISQMSSGEINKAIAKADAESSAITDELIAAGRGYEKNSETWEKTDPLSEKAKAVWGRQQELIREVQRRAGPGMYRLPEGRGFGPIKAGVEHLVDVLPESVSVTSDTQIADHNPENADMNNPDGAIHRDFYYVEAMDANGHQFVRHVGFDGKEKAERLAEKVKERLMAGGKLDATHWVETDPAYGSEAYQKEGTEQKLVEQEKSDDMARRYSKRGSIDKLKGLSEFERRDLLLKLEHEQRSDIPMLEEEHKAKRQGWKELVNKYGYEYIDDLVYDLKVLLGENLPDQRRPWTYRSSNHSKSVLTKAFAKDFDFLATPNAKITQADTQAFSIDHKDLKASVDLPTEPFMRGTEVSAFMAKNQLEKKSANWKDLPSPMKELAGDFDLELQWDEYGNEDKPDNVCLLSTINDPSVGIYGTAVTPGAKTVEELNEFVKSHEEEIIDALNSDKGNALSDFVAKYSDKEGILKSAHMVMPTTSVSAVFSVKDDSAETSHNMNAEELRQKLNLNQAQYDSLTRIGVGQPFPFKRPYTITRISDKQNLERKII